MPPVRAVLCAALAVAGLHAGEALTIEAPGQSTVLGPGGTVSVAGKGFVARQGDRLISGESLRWDEAGDALWASGSVVFVTPGVRLHADRLGLHPQARTGDAWDVTAWIERGPRQVRIRAERVELRPDRLTFRGVEADLGHGGTLSLASPTLHVYLRDQTQLRLDKGKDEIDRYVEGVAAVSPTIRAAGVPVLWLPWLYRDYLLDYPWTSLEAGNSRRLGTYGRFRIGSNLREAAGWRTRLEGRVDRHTRAGNAFGLVGYWRHRDYGRGSATWYGMAKERVADPVDETVEGGGRSAHVGDIEHYVGGRGWAAAARWSDLPDADPAATLPGNRPPDERFRSDHLRADVETKPFARRGAELAWTTPWGGITVDSARRANDYLAETDRILAAEAALNRISLLGPLGLGGSGRVERLEREDWNATTATRSESAATRASWDGAVAAEHWFGGVGLDAKAGLRGVAWSDGRLGGVDLADTPSLSVPYLTGSVRLRLASDLGSLRTILTPRLGLELLGTAQGDGNPGFDFGDQRDRPEADRRYLVTGLDGEIIGLRRLFHAQATARWALRDDDRLGTEIDGSQRRCPGRLADLAFAADGRPHLDVDLRLDGAWDRRLARWTAFDASAMWRIWDGPLAARYEGSYSPPGATLAAAWLHRPGVSLMLSRYRLDGWVEVRPGLNGEPGGRDIDRWHAGLTRRMVDGVLTLAFEQSWDPLTGQSSRSVELGFIIGGGDVEADAPLTRSFGF